MGGGDEKRTSLQARATVDNYSLHWINEILLLSHSAVFLVSLLIIPRSATRPYNISSITLPRRN